MARPGTSIRNGVAGGLIAGLSLSGAMLAIERHSGKPSDVVRLGRQGATLLGSPYQHQDSMPARDEQLRYHGLHLALSALLGALYPAWERLPCLRGAPGGALYGAALHPLFWGLIGPKLGLAPALRAQGAGPVASRIALHGLFGLVTASVAGALASRPR